MTQYLTGKGALTHMGPIYEKGGWGLSSNLRNAGLEVEMWRLRTMRGVSGCTSGC